MAYEPAGSPVDVRPVDPARVEPRVDPNVEGGEQECVKLKGANLLREGEEAPAIVEVA